MTKINTKNLMTGFMLICLFAILTLMTNTFASAQANTVAAERLEMVSEFCDNATDSISSLVDENEEEEAEALDVNGSIAIIQTV